MPSSASATRGRVVLMMVESNAANTTVAATPAIASNRSRRERGLASGGGMVMPRSISPPKAHPVGLFIEHVVGTKHGDHQEDERP